MTNPKASKQQPQINDWIIDALRAALRSAAKHFGGPAGDVDQMVTPVESFNYDDAIVWRMWDATSDKQAWFRSWGYSDGKGLVWKADLIDDPEELEIMLDWRPQDTAVSEKSEEDGE
jgi:hypothetical protein